MTEFLWYSRLILWIGAIILLVEAVTGRSGGAITVVATLCLAAGFAAFLAGLAVTRQSPAADDETSPDGGPSKP